MPKLTERGLDKRWREFTDCRRCNAKRTKEEEGQDFIVYEAPESHKIVDLYWVCDNCCPKEWPINVSMYR